MHNLQDYRYDLPEERIAQSLADPADSCNILVYNQGRITDTIFSEIPELLTTLFDTPPLICRNTTKVIPARLVTMRNGNPRGEIFFLTAQDEFSFEAKCYPGKDFKVGRTYNFPERDCSFEVVSIVRHGRLLRCSRPIMDVLLEHGHLPLPPYIDRESKRGSKASNTETVSDQTKEDAYQPHIAQQYGSLAAPTATLHFTPQTFTDLSKHGCDYLDTTLHIGLGTFQVVEHADIRDHPLHSEQIVITYDTFHRVAQAKLSDRPVLAVGTTVTRTLESLPAVRSQASAERKSQFGPDIQRYREQISNNEQTSSVLITDRGTPQTATLYAYSNHYIYPGVPVRIIDVLITNFHLPHSSLLMLVAGFVGYHQMRSIYDHALAGEYKFFSFGDAMLLLP